MDLDKLLSGFGNSTIALDLKSKVGKDILMKLLKDADVLLEPFRPGVLESLGFAPEILLKNNPRLIIARLTGWGQTGPLAMAAGHDINYIAISGILSLFSRSKTEPPLPPVNILGDFAGGGMLCALGIMFALYERDRSGKGQVVDTAMVDGVPHLASFLVRLRANGAYSDEPGTNPLDSGSPFYNSYACKDGKFLSVGCIEPQFYKLFIEGIQVTQLPEFSRQNDRKTWPKMKATITEVLKTKTRDEWAHIFRPDGPYRDACVAPILTIKEAASHPHNTSRSIYREHGKGPDDLVVTPAPRLSRTPGEAPLGSKGIVPLAGQHSKEILKEVGLSEEEIEKLLKEKSITQSKL